VKHQVYGRLRRQAVAATSRAHYSNHNTTEEQAVMLTQAVEEFIRVKAENQRLKVKMKTFSQGDQRYKKLELEVDHLSWQLNKVFYRQLYFMKYIETV
jgi:cell shape-determining protein MreC